MSDQLAKDLQDKAKIDATSEEKPDSKPKKFAFKAASAFNPGSSFNPGQYGQYGGGSSQYGQYGGSSQYGQYGGQSSYGYNNYSNYAQQPAASPAPAEDSGMTLEEFQKSKKADLNTRAAPKKIISTSGSSGIKIGGKTPTIKIAKKEEPKESTPKAETPQPEEAKASTSKATTPKASTSNPESKAKDTKATASKDASKPITEKVDADAVIKEQEKLDKELVEDMFGGENIKEHMSVIFMGHVDAGKSTMGGNLLYLTESVDKRTVEKYEKEAIEAGRQGWYLSWVMDTNSEERNEGKTIEVGRAKFETEKRRYTLLDAPGHKMYVPSMIGGASQADAGILVISARRGEYETGFEKGGQTREHAILAKTQGVEKLLVVVNKMDDTTVEWSEERYKECTSKLGVFLKATGYTDVTYMPVSGFTGEGLKARVRPEVCPWYSGPSLLEWLDAVPLENRKLQSPFMLPISGKGKELGTVVEGKIESGSVKKGNQLLVMPGKHAVEVAAIFGESEEELPGAICGEQVKLRIKGIEEEDMSIGYVLTSSKNPVRAVTRIEAQVALVELKSILTAGYTAVMHVHTAIEEVSFVKLLHKLEKGTNRKSKKPPAFAKRGMKIIAELELASPVCVETFAELPQLGRFTLRDQGVTIAIGKITKLLG